MLVVIVYFSLASVLIASVIVFYLIKYNQDDTYGLGERRKYILIKYGIITLFIATIIYFTININEFITKPSSIVEPILLIISNFFILFTIVIFKNSNPFKKKKIVMKTHFPLILRSKKGTIDVGKVIRKGHATYLYKLSLDDLAQHMFVCGTTGSGKSNYLQHFLLEFSKNHRDIPFLLTEFKGEYQFLQKEIKDLLLTRYDSPGIKRNINGKC